MPSNYFKGIFLPDVKRVRQITASHCAPAVVEMLLSKIGVSASQTQIAEAGGMGARIASEGMTIDELAVSIGNLYTDLIFWYKFNSEIYDLRYIVELYHYPVGVEWQGEFDHKDSDEDPGHYGVVTHVDMDQGYLLIADPYYPIRDRKFNIENFNQRWWDISERTDPQTQGTKKFYDEKPMFIVTPRSATFPEVIGMLPATNGLIQR